MVILLVLSSSWQTIATSILPPPMMKWSYLQDLSAPKKSSLGFFTSPGLMQWLLSWLRRAAMLAFAWAAYCAGIPGMFISSIIVFDCHLPGSIIESLAITPDLATAWATSLLVAL